MEVIHLLLSRLLEKEESNVYRFRLILRRGEVL